MSHSYIRIALLSVMAAAAGMAQTAPGVCSASVTPGTIRSEGQAELVGEYVLTCTGGTPRAAGVALPTIDFTAFLNVDVTSRLLTSPWSEALLLIDDPVTTTQSVCATANGLCSITGTGTGAGVYSGAQGRPNVFQGQVNAKSPNQISWNAIPFDFPGPKGTRVLRFTNVRVAALNGPTPNVQMIVSATGQTPPTINNGTQVVAFNQPGAGVSVKNVQNGTSGPTQFTVSFAEKFANVFKTRTAAAFLDANTPPPPVNESTPGTINPGSETGFYNSLFPIITGRGNLNTAGLGDDGTRLIITLPNIPSGVVLTAPLTVPVASAAGAAAGVARLVTTDSVGGGAFSAAKSTQITIVNGVAVIVYEIMQANPQGLETADVPISLSYAPGATLQSVSVSAGLGPLSVIAAASASAPLPRFNSPVQLTLGGPLTILTTVLPNAAMGSAYSYQLQAAGGTAPYTWSATGLPAGMTVSAAGLINGTSNTPGTYNLVVTVNDGARGAASGKLTLTVGGALQFTNTKLPNATVGSPYSQALQVTGGGTPYSLALAPSSPFFPNALPDGLLLSPSGTVSGIPTTTGTFSFLVVVTDAGNNNATASISLTITPALAITTASPLPDGAVGLPYTQTLAATGGTPPYTFTLVGAAPPALTLSPGGVLSGTPAGAGTVNFTVQVTDSLGVVVTKAFQVTVSVSVPAIQVPVTELDFFALTDGDSPGPQGVQIVSTSDTQAAYRLQADGGTANTPAPAWLKIRLPDGITPSRRLIFVTQAGLKAGSYSARIRILIPKDATQAPTDVIVNLTVTDALPEIDTFPNVVRFRAHAATPGVQDEVLVVRNKGGAGPVKFTAAAVGGAWIASITPSSGQVGPDAPVYLTVRVNTAGLAAGGARDLIRIKPEVGKTVDVPVALFVAPPGPILGVNVSGLRFRGRATHASATPQDVPVLNIGDAGTTVNWKAELLRGSEWLSITTPTGTAVPGSPGTLTVVPTANVASLPAGARYALIRISDPNARNSPQYVVAVLDLVPAETPATPDPLPAGLLFTASPGALQPAAQAVLAWTNNNSAIPFVAATSTDDGQNWLSVSPAVGTSTSNAPGRIVVTANAAGLAPGIYTGDVNVSIAGTVRTTNAMLVVASAAAGDTLKARAAGCGATRIGIAQVGTVNNFSVPAGWPTTLMVKLTDDCGVKVSGASVAASFSNGDPPISLIGDGASGTYSRSWQPGRAASQMTVTVDALASGLPAARVQLTGAVGANSQAGPVLAPNGTLHNSNPQVGAPLAPNTVAQVFGTGLASTVVSPGVVPLLTEFNGTSILVGAFEAPLYFLSPNQVNIQIPAELAPIAQYPVVVFANNVPTLVPDSVTLNTVQPGVNQFLDGTIIAQHGADFSLVDSSKPAKPGEVLVMYLAGMGATSPAVASSLTAPGTEPLARVTTPATVTVDGQDAAIGYAGLTPFGIGLYQINFVVPMNARTGNLDVIVRQGDAVSNTTRLPVAQ